MIIDFIRDNWVEVVGAFWGFLYLYFELKARKAMFPIGMLMSAFYVWVFFQRGFYAFALINIYFIFGQAHAWAKWHKGSPSTEAVPIHMPHRVALPLIGLVVLLFGLLWGVLLQFPNESSVAWGDSLITTLSIVALWMLSKRYVEQWLPLIVANLLSVYLFYNQHMYPSALLYAVYLVASFVGYVGWRKMAKNTPISK